VKLARTIIRLILVWPTFFGWLFPPLFVWACKSFRINKKTLVLSAEWRDWVVDPSWFAGLIRWPFGRKYVLVGGETIAGMKVPTRMRLARESEKATHRSWWKFSTTLMRGMIFQPGRRSEKSEPPSRIERHEQVHVEQGEDRVILAFIISLVWLFISGHDPLKTWGTHVAIWISGAVWQLPNFLGAVLRGEHFYRGAQHEKSAYAQTDTEHTTDLSWLDVYETEDQSL
jgi:hypothetical protein